MQLDLRGVRDDAEPGGLGGADNGHCTESLHPPPHIAWKNASTISCYYDRYRHSERPAIRTAIRLFPNA
jgi:hypothetical protein